MKKPLHLGVKKVQLGFNTPLLLQGAGAKKAPKKELDSFINICYNRSIRDNQMASETEEYYNKYFDLFQKDGWKQLVEELQQNALVINSVEATKDSNDLYMRKGQLNVLAYILNLEATINANYDEFIKDND